MATPAARGYTGGAASGSTASATLGASTAVGDLLIIFQGNDFYTAAGMPTPTSSQTLSSLTLRATGDAGTNFPHMKIWTAVTTVAGTQTVSTGPSPDEEVYINVAVIDGSTVDVSNFIDGTATGGGSSTASTSHVAPSVTTTSAADSLLICGVVAATGASTRTYTPPTGMTEQTDLQDGVFAATSTASLILSAIGATGTKTFTYAGSTAYASASIAVKGGSPVAGAPVKKPLTVLQAVNRSFTY